jgi:hypothetical protein
MSPGHSAFDEGSNLGYSSNIASTSSEPLNLLDPLESLVAESGIETELGSGDLSVPGSSNLASTSQTQPISTNIFSSNGMEMVPSQSAGPSVITPNFNKSQADPFFREVFNEQLDGIDTELSWLHDQLTTGGLNIDTSSLLGLFSSDSMSQIISAASAINGGNIDPNKFLSITGSAGGIVPNLDFTSITANEEASKNVTSPDFDLDSLLGDTPSLNSTMMPQTILSNNTPTGPLNE